MFDVISTVSAQRELTYLVVDNGSLIELGKHARPSIQFVDFADEKGAFEAARGADLLFMSSVLHYIPQVDAFLQRLMDECRPDLLYIARHYSPDALDRSVAATQCIYTPSGYAGEAAIHLIPEMCLARELSGQYQLLLSTINNVPNYFPSSFDKLNIREKNFLFRRHGN